MELKKSKKADLESRRSQFVLAGLVIVLGLLLLAFEWTSSPIENNMFDQGEELVAEEEMIPITRQQETPPPPPPPPPQVVEVLQIVEDDVDIEEFEFDDIEADEDMEMDFVAFEEEEEEVAEEVFFIVEDMPSFKGGGLEAFRNWVQKSMVYPEIAQENGIQGKVYVQFAVNAAGKVVDAKVVRGVDPALDQEALRAVKNSPSWSPGKQRGRPVKVQFTMPIVFLLQ